MDELRCAIEYREDESRQSPGRIVGVLIAYGERALDRAEKFEAGVAALAGRRDHPKRTTQPASADHEIHAGGGRKRSAD